MLLSDSFRVASCLSQFKVICPQLCFLHGFLALSNVSEETADTAFQYWNRSTFRMYSEIPVSVFDS